MEEIDAKMRAQKEEFLATRRSAQSLAGARAEREAQVSLDTRFPGTALTCDALFNRWFVH